MGAFQSKSEEMNKESVDFTKEWLAKYHSIDHEPDLPDFNNLTITKNDPSAKVRDLPSPTYTGKTFVVAKINKNEHNNGENDPFSSRVPVDCAVNPTGAKMAYEQAYEPQNRNGNMLVLPNIRPISPNAVTPLNTWANTLNDDQISNDGKASVIASRIAIRGK